MGAIGKRPLLTALKGVASGGEIRRRVRNFIDVIVSPVTYCSLFYGLYYLVRVKGVREFDEELRKVIDDLYDAFFDYGIFIVGEELWDMHYAFGIMGVEESEEILDYEDFYEAVLEGRVREETSDYEDFYEAVLEGRVHHPNWIREMARRVVNNAYPELSRGERWALAEMIEKFITLPIRGELVRVLAPDIPTVEDVLSFCMQLEREFSAFSQPHTFLRRAALIFEMRPETCDCGGWLSLYGGAAWAKIARTLLMRDELPKTVWIDACWGLEHQTGGFVANKLWVSEYDQMLVERVTGERLNDLVIWKVVLPDILDDKRKGNMREVLRFAVHALPDFWG